LEVQDKKPDDEVSRATLNRLNVLTMCCARGGECLEWCIPEQSVQTRLYREFKRLEPRTGWHAYPIEAHYVTFYPVTIPRAAHGDWKKRGAIK